MSFLRQLGLAIRSARRVYHLTQEDLAEVTGISERTIRAVEQGRPGVAVGTVLTVAHHVGLELRLRDAPIWPHHALHPIHSRQVRAMIEKGQARGGRISQREGEKVQRAAEALRPVREAAARRMASDGWDEGPGDHLRLGR